MVYDSSHGISIKKRYSQVFLRDASVTHEIVSTISLDASTNVFEIGCGDGFLTRAILQENIAQLWVFEIDSEWVDYITSSIKDPRLTVQELNILDYNFLPMEPYKPWVLLANLPYQVTFPILYLLQRHRDIVREGIIMVQEEVAQKIVKKSGRGYGYPSLFLQRYFEWRLLRKVMPSSFQPSPKVDSRLMYFKTKTQIEPIEQEEDFWKFIKMCYHQPRRTLRNNLAQSHYPINVLSPETLALRAQQMSMSDLLEIWKMFLATDYHT